MNLPLPPAVRAGADLLNRCGALHIGQAMVTLEAKSWSSCFDPKAGLPSRTMDRRQYGAGPSKRFRPRTVN
jgi:hypothetical protein